MKPAYKPSISFADKTLMVSLNIRTYGAQKVDKKISRKVTAEHAADSDAGNFNKHLVPKEAMEPVTKAISALRTFHNENTLPWLDDGIRVLPSANYEAYKTEVEGLKDAFDSAVHAFCNDWPAIVAKAQASLGTMFNPADYPVDIRSRFSCVIRFMPIADADDFRVNISDTEREILREQMEGHLSAAASEATGDLYRRLTESVKCMGQRLRAYSVDPVTGKTSSPFRDSLVENLRDLVKLIPRLNFAEDAELEAIRVMVERDLCAADASELREDDATRERVATAADDITKRLGEFMA